MGRRKQDGRERSSEERSDGPPAESAEQAAPPDAEPDWIEGVQRRLLEWYTDARRDLPWRAVDLSSPQRDALRRWLGTGWPTGAKARYATLPKFNYEAPLTFLVWLTSIVSIALTYVVSYLIIPDLGGDSSLWWKLSTVITCGTLAGALIPELVERAAIDL